MSSSYWIPLPDTITGPRPSPHFPIYFVLLCILWSLIYYLSPAGKKAICYLSIAHATLVTYTSLACIFRGDDTAFTCAASVSFFVVDGIGMAFNDGLLGGGGSSDSKKPIALSRKMDYGHHVLGVLFGLIEHYYENDLCPAHVGCAFIYVQWNEISTPFYNLFRLTGQQIWGALFALSFFLARVVGNTFIIIPLLYGNCSSLLGVFCVPYFLLQYLWFYLIVQKMRKSAGGDKTKSEKKKLLTPSLSDIKTD